MRVLKIFHAYFEYRLQKKLMILTLNKETLFEEDLWQLFFLNHHNKNLEQK